MTRQLSCMPYPGQPPLVQPGEAVQVRDAVGNWHPARCGSRPRFDTENALGRRVWLTVRVDAGNGWVNWPAEHVRAAQLAPVPLDSRRTL